MLRKLLILGLVVILLVGWQIRNFVYQPQIIRGENNIIINKGASTASVANELANAGIIDKPLLFRLAARISGMDKKLKAGG